MKFLLCIIFTGFVKLAFPQESDELLLSSSTKININIDDTVFEFHAIKPVKTGKTTDHVFYYWFKDGKIFATQGAYSGKVMDGSYRRYYPGRNLMELGQFSNGVKTGKWQFWYTNGILRETTNWSKSTKNGSFEMRDSLGILIRKGKFKNDKLEGDIIDYLPNGKKIKTTYNHGELVPEKKNEGEESE